MGLILIVLFFVAAGFVGGYLIGWTRGKKGFPRIPMPGQP